MELYTWLREFAAFIQLISAANFAYVFDSFTKRIYNRIFSYEELIGKKFASFREGELAKFKMSVSNMNHSVLPLDKFEEYRNKLQQGINDIEEEWNKKEEELNSYINTRISEVKGVKSLFMYISIYCVVDMFNMALINAIEWRPACIFVYLTNISAIICSLLITLKIIRSSWKEKEDAYCFNKVLIYIGATVAIAILLTLLNEILICFIEPFDTPFLVNAMLLSFCITLPVYSFLFSIIFILYNIYQVNKQRKDTENILKDKIKEWENDKKNVENAISTLTKTIGWV